MKITDVVHFEPYFSHDLTKLPNKVDMRFAEYAIESKTEYPISNINRAV
jgi:hypothetical protein